MLTAHVHTLGLSLSLTVKKKKVTCCDTAYGQAPKCYLKCKRETDRHLSSSDMYETEMTVKYYLLGRYIPKFFFLGPENTRSCGLLRSEQTAFTYSFHKHLLNVSYGPGPVLGAVRI